MGRPRFSGSDSVQIVVLSRPQDRIDRRMAFDLYLLTPTDLVPNPLQQNMRDGPKHSCNLKLALLGIRIESESGPRGRRVQRRGVRQIQKQRGSGLVLVFVDRFRVSVANNDDSASV